MQLSLIGICSFLLLAVGLCMAKTKPSSHQLQVIKQIIRNQFQAKLALQPAAVRLAFHDCVGGSCNGCVNLDLDSNRGLEDIVEKYKEIIVLPNVSPFMTYADLWSLGAIVAVEMGIDIANKMPRCTRSKECMPKLSLTFEWGRTDCSTAPLDGETPQFCDGSMSRSEMLKFFRDEFQFSPREVAALMGAHTLGKAQLKNSGYEGAWIVGQENAFDNQFYKFLVGQALIFKKVENVQDGAKNGKFQFNLFNKRTRRVGMMLRTDMELYYLIHSYGNRGHQCKINNNKFNPFNPTIGISTGKEGIRPVRRVGESSGQGIGTGGTPLCPRAPSDTSAAVKEFSENMNAFVVEFRKVFEKMMRHGNIGLVPIKAFNPIVVIKPIKGGSFKFSKQRSANDTEEESSME